MNAHRLPAALGLVLLVGLLTVPAALGAVGQPGSTATVSSFSSDSARGIGAAASAQAEQKGKPKPRWRPTNRRAYFNNPYGGDTSRYALQSYLVKAIRNTPKTGIIRISVYSFDRGEVADALLDAKKRGVTIQILMNDHQVTRAQRRLFKRLGKNARKNNFAYECKNSCRARRDNLHSKFFLFSRTGGVDNVIMLGSVNFTLNAVKWQWNDLVSLTGEEVLFRQMVKLFDDMRKDYSSNQRYYTFCGRERSTCNPTKSPMFMRVFPRKANATNDAVLDLLKPIKCTYKAGGKMHRTALRLSMHAMRGPRGDYLASRIRRLWANGCDVKVIYGLMGARTKGILGATTARGRIPLRSAGFDYDGDGEVNRYTHHKYFTINGMYAGQQTKMIFTGSSNWSTRGTSGDEIMFSLRGPRIWGQYQNNFAFMFNSSRHTRNAYTTTASEYRTTVLMRDATGRMVPRTVTRKRVVTSNEPDNIAGSGPTWEND